MKFFTELTESVETLVENTKSGKKYFIEGKFLSADMPNRNRRIYPKRVMEKAVDRYEREFINEKRALGELNHPNSGPSINLDKACHVLESLWFKGSDVYGKARVLSTPMGNILKTLIDEDIKIGVSSRGLGSLKKLGNNLNEVQDDYYIAAVDVVSDPSGIGCYVNGIMESTEWRLNEKGEWIPHYDEIINEKDLNVKKLELFEKFLNSIR